ncbi:L,D-transpeptidase ErfK/SrfK [Chromohalobacter marismortui]|uniref:L,D-transpeptidase ErfK/SrfK n=1 Tax=Chromohalobacter marismortui TaxID=42055 RepID=A0A4R7NVC1_9GAMM|nr:MULTISPECIES: L,D-transpeptidase family protein [Chromohalobacter]MCI0510407.1 L,D-transpeptidase family protein [Chromohalobacter sp.]MCI0594661.1 L,D-transpeptidase family protein [Chromohalobacter sp.]TDU25017.1 L,D-transpeptidase ErfK/SrfK [Chromohalobacter marismortui]
MPVTSRGLTPLWLATLLSLSTTGLADTAPGPVITPEAAGLPQDTAPPHDKGVTRFVVPENGNIVGKARVIETEKQDTLLDIGRRYGVGYEAMRRANPGISVWYPGEGTEVTIPSRFILPEAAHQGVVVNIPEMRLYYYPPSEDGKPAQVETYAISVGRMDWSTPLGETRITAKQKNPAWYPPQSIIEEHAADGRELPNVVPPGPDNPLGQYKMRLAIPGYLIHGTNRPQGIGMRVTHGCIRMYPEDVEHLFGKLPVGTNVNLISQPTKFGWRDGTLYVQSFPLLEEDRQSPVLKRVLDASEALVATLTHHQIKDDIDHRRLTNAVLMSSGTLVALNVAPKPEKAPRVPMPGSLYDALPSPPPLLYQSIGV